MHAYLYSFDDRLCRDGYTDYTANYDEASASDTRSSFSTMLQDEDDATIQNFLEMDNSQISQTMIRHWQLRPAFRHGWITRKSWEHIRPRTVMNVL